MKTIDTTAARVAAKVPVDQKFRLDLGIRYLIPEWKRMLRPEGLLQDVSAGLTVACVAIPLALAIALASHVEPAVGLVTAIIAGVVCALTGGTPLAVCGPAAAMAVLIAANVEEFGLGGLLVIGFGCGLLQLLCGVFGLGKLIRYIPIPVIAGFTAGIGAIILIGQLPRAFGLPAPDQGHVLHVFKHIGNLWPQSQWTAVMLTGTAVAVIRWLPRIAPKLPAPLIGVAASSLLAYFMHWDVALIGEIPRSLPMPKFPSLPTEGLGALFANVLMVFALASLESLLSSSAVDKITKGAKHDPDQELIGQGLGNMSVSLFGGIPVTGVIVRSSLNVHSGAVTRRSAIVHSLTLLATVFVLAPMMGRIPIAALAGVLINIALNMMDIRELRQLWRVSKRETLIYGITFVTIVFVDLIAGVQAGIIAAMAIAVISLGQLRLIAHTHENESVLRLSLNGPLTFLASAKFQEVTRHIKGAGKSQSLVLDLSSVTALDSSGASMLLDLVGELKGRQMRVVLRGLGLPLQETLVACDVAGLTSGLHAATESEVDHLLAGPLPPEPHERLVFGVERFRREQRHRYESIFARLAENQYPHTLMITCSDSRITPSLITSTDPGEMFLVRNVGNVVTPFGHDDTPAEGAAVEYAVGVLGVKQIIVCGHTGCGAMRAVLDGFDEKQLPTVHQWLARLQNWCKEHPEVKDPTELAKHNVLKQLNNLRTYPMVSEKVKNGELQLIGWLYDVGHVDILEWNGQEFTPVGSKPRR